MIHDQPGPLTPEERELADRLARLPASGGPAPALDARILAAARAAVGGPPRPARRRRRWPVVFGVAASLALAFGIAWRLRPLPDAGVEYSEAPAAASMQTTPAIAADDTMAPETPAAAAAGVPEAAQRARPRAPGAADARAARAAPEAFPQPEQPKAIVAGPEQPTAVAEASAVAPSSPPPAPPAPAATDQAGVARMRATPPRDSAAPQAVTGNRDDADALAPTGEAATATGEYGDQSIDDQPPATADSPEVQQAWLQRIRELIAAGETDAARASLEEFRRRYPGAALPEDLRAFGK